MYVIDVIHLDAPCPLFKRRSLFTANEGIDRRQRNVNNLLWNHNFFSNGKWKKNRPKVDDKYKWLLTVIEFLDQFMLLSCQIVNFQPIILLPSTTPLTEWTLDTGHESISVWLLVIVITYSLSRKCSSSCLTDELCALKFNWLFHIIVITEHETETNTMPWIADTQCFSFPNRIESKACLIRHFFFVFINW